MLSACVLIACFVSAAAAPPAQGAKETSAIANSETDETLHFDVSVKGAYIYVTTPRAVTLQLYSILGQLVTQQAVQPGTTRIKAPSRGVYILKAGPVTRRVTVNVN